MTADAAPGEDLLKVEYLYAIEAEHYQGDDNRLYVPKRVITFRIVRKTPKRIYYLRHERRGRSDVGYIDRLQIEADGELFRKSAGWWEVDARLYLEAPELEEYAPAPDLDALKAAMRTAHPDVGGSHEAFLEAHERYERARVNARAASGS
ncbi:hypothetical protein [Streptomyces sp. NPDC005548]|uniref:hypothetical protein n=1 Tax=Streptomyces sp. NPDC005548 TaxID=3364724 RepID=UPI003679A171